MRATSLLAPVLLVASMPSAAAVYKCDVAGKTVYTDAKCEASTEAMDLATENSFGGSTRAAEVRFDTTACLIPARGYGKATGWVVNQTGDSKLVAVESVFTRDGAIVDTVTLRYTVPPFGRVPFDHTASGSPTHCSNSLSWD